MPDVRRQADIHLALNARYVCWHTANALQLRGIYVNCLEKNAPARLTDWVFAPHVCRNCACKSLTSRPRLQMEHALPVCLYTPLFPCYYCGDRLKVFSENLLFLHSLNTAIQ
jgi:hypothetical protein